MHTVSSGPTRGQISDLLSAVRVARVAIRRAGIPAGAVDDVLQDALLSAWAMLCEGAAPENVGGWLVTIAANRARYYRARCKAEQSRYEQQALPGITLAAPVASPERVAADRQRLAIVMRMPVQDRALLTRAALGDVDDRPGLQHARERLRQTMQALDGPALSLPDAMRGKRRLRRLRAA